MGTGDCGNVYQPQGLKRTRAAPVKILVATVKQPMAEHLWLPRSRQSSHGKAPPSPLAVDGTGRLGNSLANSLVDTLPRGTDAGWRHSHARCLGTHHRSQRAALDAPVAHLIPG